MNHNLPPRLQKNQSSRTERQKKIISLCSLWVLSVLSLLCVGVVACGPLAERSASLLCEVHLFMPAHLAVLCLHYPGCLYCPLGLYCKKWRQCFLQCVCKVWRGVGCTFVCERKLCLCIYVCEGNWVCMYSIYESVCACSRKLCLYE